MYIKSFIDYFKLKPWIFGISVGLIWVTLFCFGIVYFDSATPPLFLSILAVFLCFIGFCIYLVIENIREFNEYYKEKLKP